MTITPNLKVEKTISNPLETSQVIGFEGRDSRRGVEAIILKNATDDSDEVALPFEYGKQVRDGEATLYVLTESYVYVYDQKAYDPEDRGIEGETFHVVQLDDAAERLTEDDVGVGN